MISYLLKLDDKQHSLRRLLLTRVLNVFFPHKIRTLAVGAASYKLEVTVTNKGDDAYNAKLYAKIPKGIKIGRIFTVRNVDGDDVSVSLELSSYFP